MNAADWIHDLTIVGCFAIALYCLAHSRTIMRLFRAPSLADKARQAERMQREFDRSKMQPRYTPPPQERRRAQHNHWNH